MNEQLNFMQQAVELSSAGMHNREGGPFGCVIVKEGKVIGKGNNKVFLNNDPTAHAEIVAIRDACAHLQTNTLDGCELYTSCEPCPMCLSAIYWARIKKIYYANTSADAARIGFDDEAIYRELAKPKQERLLPAENLGREIAIKVFNEWHQKEDKELY
ncbi:MAG: nucleoside deaminase [Bacteroidota bacterium]|nr:nucleoside deaminase [Bacteroidota bacterium]